MNAALAALGLLRRDLRLGLRRRGELLNPLVFFLLVITLFPLGVGPSPQLLATIAPGGDLGGGFAGHHAVARAAVP